MKNESMTFEELKKIVLTLRDKYTGQLAKMGLGRGGGKIFLAGEIQALNEILIMIEEAQYGEF